MCVVYIRHIVIQVEASPNTIKGYFETRHLLHSAFELQIPNILLLVYFCRPREPFRVTYGHVGIARYLQCDRTVFAMDACTMLSLP